MNKTKLSPIKAFLTDSLQLTYKQKKQILSLDDLTLVDKVKTRLIPRLLLKLDIVLIEDHMYIKNLQYALDSPSLTESLSIVSKVITYLWKRHVDTYTQTMKPIVFDWAFNEADRQFNEEMIDILDL